jgi:hypothetical protein
MSSSFDTWRTQVLVLKKQAETLFKIAMRWANRTLYAALSLWILRARREKYVRRAAMQLLHKGENVPLNSAFDTWVLYTCREHRMREIEANNLVSSYMSEKEAEWESETSVLRSVVDELHEEVHTLQGEFESAHLTTVRRAKELILREQTRAQERLDDAALELERVRTELIHSTSQPVKKGRGGDGAETRRHMAFF